MVRRLDWAEPSLAARREARRLGMAIAAMMPMIATTISSSMSEKPPTPASGAGPVRGAAGGRGPAEVSRVAGKIGQVNPRLIRIRPPGAGAGAGQARVRVRPRGGGGAHPGKESGSAVDVS